MTSNVGRARNVTGDLEQSRNSAESRRYAAGMTPAEGYISDLFSDLRERASEAQRGEYTNADYQAGRLRAFQEVLSMMQNRAIVFELSLDALGMAGLDPLNDRLDPTALPFTHFRCLCCGCRTLAEAPPGTFDICPVCFWEDDKVQAQDPSYRGGANVVSLTEARANYLRVGASEERFLGNVRAPLPEELPPTRKL